jgi:Regulator of chromosome condensation (RCC1) repeat
MMRRYSVGGKARMGSWGKGKGPMCRSLGWSRRSITRNPLPFTEAPNIRLQSATTEQQSTPGDGMLRHPSVYERGQSLSRAPFQALHQHYFWISAIHPVCRGDFGRLGHGHGNDVLVPTKIGSLAGKVVSSVSCGDAHTLVVLETGRLMAFGRNQNGQVGNGTNVDAMDICQVHGLDAERIVGSACGAEHSVCVTEGGAVYAWCAALFWTGFAGSPLPAGHAAQRLHVSVGNTCRPCMCRACMLV